MTLISLVCDTRFPRVKAFFLLNAVNLITMKLTCKAVDNFKCDKNKGFFLTFRIMN